MRIVLGDDHVMLLDALQSALASRGHGVVGATTSPREFCRLVAEHGPDVGLLDVNFPDRDVDDTMHAVREASQRTRVVMFSGSTDPRDVTLAMDAGAVGFISKDQTLDGVMAALDRVQAGDTVVRHPSPPARTRGLSPGTDDAKILISYLTPREREVLRRTVAGEDTTQIARGMDVAVSTVRTHAQHVLNKLGVHSRLEAVAFVITAGLADEFTDEVS